MKKYTNSGQFKKGIIPFNKGKKGLQKHTEEWKKMMKEKMSGKNHWNFGRRYKGKPRPDIKGRIPWNKGKKCPEISEKLTGKHPSLATRKKQSSARIGRFGGENSPVWKGGISKNPYPKEFNRALKLKIRTRDDFTCCRCKRTEREELEELNRVLCVNHIDFDKNNLSEKNLNTLCLRCNIQINREREYWTSYFQ